MATCAHIQQHHRKRLSRNQLPAEACAISHKFEPRNDDVKKKRGRRMPPPFGTFFAFFRPYCPMPRNTACCCSERVRIMNNISW